MLISLASLSTIYCRFVLVSIINFIKKHICCVWYGQNTPFFPYIVVFFPVFCGKTLFLLLYFIRTCAKTNKYTCFMFFVKVSL